MSIGEGRVRVKFNPSANGLVDQIKQKSAELINLVATMEEAAKSTEQARCATFASKAFEEGAMWAVKAATA